MLYGGIPLCQEIYHTTLKLATIVNSEIRVTDGAKLSQQANSESRSVIDQ